MTDREHETPAEQRAGDRTTEITNRDRHELEVTRDELNAVTIRAQRRVNRALAITLGAMVLFVMVAALVLARMATTLEQTRELTEANSIVLTATLEQRDTTIDEQSQVIDQAVAAIQRLAGQVVELGGNPGTVILKPTTTTIAPGDG